MMRALCIVRRCTMCHCHFAHTHAIYICMVHVSRVACVPALHACSTTMITWFGSMSARSPYMAILKHYQFCYVPAKPLRTDCVECSMCTSLTHNLHRQSIIEYRTSFPSKPPSPSNARSQPWIAEITHVSLDGLSRCSSTSNTRSSQTGPIETLFLTDST